MIATTRAVVCLAVALLAAVSRAQEGAVGALTTIDGRELKGRVSFTAEGDVTVAGTGAPVSLALDEVSAFAAEGVLPDPVLTPCRIWLRSGLELGAVALRGVPAGDGKPARLRAELPVGATVELPLTALRALLHCGPERERPPSFDADLRDPADNTDMLWVQKDGKQHRFQVTVSGMRADAIEFDLRGSQHEFALDGVVAVIFGNNTGFAADRQPPPRVAVDFGSGDHLEGRLLGLGDEIRLRLDEGCEVAVPARSVLRFTVDSDRVRWLSELTPKVEQTPAFDRAWPWTKDRSIAGPGLVIGGQTWRRGVGMVPRTRLCYDLGGEFTQFRAVIGIDDRGGPQAHAIFRVLVDGKVAYESAPKTRGLPPEVVEVPLTGCRQLAIEVDFGKNYDLGDYCAFADARVLR